jgi:hypothetical protein
LGAWYGDSDPMEINIREPKRFRLLQVIVGSLIAAIPSMVSFAVTVLGLGLLVIMGRHPAIGLFILALLWVWALLSVGILVYLAPFVASGAPMVRWFPRDLGARDRENAQRIWELSLRPRIRKGLRAGLDDADDIGFLRLDENALRFDGDSVNLVIPYLEIETVRLRNCGWRGLWVCGGTVVVTVRDGEKERTFVFRERSALTVPRSRQITENVFHALRYTIGATTDSLEE